MFTLLHEPIEKTEWHGWVPFGIGQHASGPIVDWCYLGQARFREPFFDQTIHQHQRSSQGSDHYRVTSLDTLINRQAIQPGLYPTGFIFHVGRCGSTLITQMLAADPENIVISEPSILDRALFASQDWDQVQAMRGIVSALGQRREEIQKHYFIKFTSRSILAWPLIHRAFPDVPWIFVYRDPIEVLTAHLGRQTHVLPPGLSESGLLPGDAAFLRQMRPDEFWARVLASRCEAALQFLGHGRSLLVNYAQLPGLVWETLPNFFGMSCSTEAIAQMQQTAAFDAKNPLKLFSSDRETKRQAANDWMRALIADLVMPYYRQLENLRLAQV